MFIVQLIEATYNFLWGDLFQIPLPGGGSIGISLLIIFLVPAAVYLRFVRVLCSFACSRIWCVP